MTQRVTGVLFTRVSLFFSALIICHSLYAQATGSIVGTVTDTAGSPAPGAALTVTAPATGLSRSATTDERGEYVVPLLGVGTYNIRIELKGFQPAESKGITLQVDEHRELDFKLAPATVSTTVEVSETVVAIQTSDATLGQVITSQQVADLPLNGVSRKKHVSDRVQSRLGKCGAQFHSGCPGKQLVRQGS